MTRILEEIREKADPAYKVFHQKLIPTVDPERVLGLRAPFAKAIAKKYASTSEGEAFLCNLPHRYYDENIVHAFMLGRLKCTQDELKCKLIRFLPYVDNWAVCDGLCAHLKSFFRKPQEVYSFVRSCALGIPIPQLPKSTYTVRFGLVCLLSYYIDKEHLEDILSICQSIKSDEYYINMAVAWLVSFCLIKEYDGTLPLIKEKRLPVWVHNKAIQKARESYRITKEQKEYLNTLKIKQA